MRSVPPRGSGWVSSRGRDAERLTSTPLKTHAPAEFRRGVLLSLTHPLPRGGTDLMTRERIRLTRGDLMRGERIRLTRAESLMTRERIRLTRAEPHDT